MRAQDLGAALRTVRYLRPSQVMARASFVAERRLARADPALLPTRFARLLESAETALRDAPPIWRWPTSPLDPGARANRERARDVLEGRFSFLNQVEILPLPLIWQQPIGSRLWRFHLFGFRFAIDLAALARSGEARAWATLRDLVSSFLETSPVSADDAWHPYVVADRAIAWCVSRDLMAPNLVSEPAFALAWRRALLTHGLYLERHLERDVGGNHLLKNAVALLLLGCAFEGPHAELWRGRAARILEAELVRQVLADGGHYERSPMYHLLVLEDLLVALLAAGKRGLPVSVALAEAVRRMQRFALTLQHPDGEIPLFNDAALGEAPRPRSLVGPSTDALGNALPESGYFRLPVGASAGSWAGVLIADCGPPGPDDLPAHSHADALSYELSVGAVRVLVDGGTSSYEAGPERTALRGTSAHNTVQVDNADQSEVWGAFRVGRRARVRLDAWVERAGGATLIGSHDGYSYLGVRHERRIDSVPDAGWRVLDRLTGCGTHRADSRIRLDPAFVWARSGSDFVAMDQQGGEVLRLHPFGGAEAKIETGWYAPRFSQVQSVGVLRLSRGGALPIVFGYWLLLPGCQPKVI